MFNTAILGTAFTELSSDMSSTLALLDSYGNAGLVITPNEPTKSMLDAGAKVADISTEQLRRIYQIMINSQD
jgi:hypothetical protein